MRRLLGAALAAVIVGGCQQAPPTRMATQSVVVGSRTTKLVTEGDALAAQKDWAGAALKYQAALNDEPSEVKTRFALASALTHLGRREEAVDHFNEVVRRGKPGSAEVRIARDWLIAASAADASAMSSASTNSASAATPAEPAPTTTPTTGRVSGKLAYQNIDPRDRRILVAITLTGDDISNRDVRRRRGDFRIGRGYEFNNLLPGTYTLFAEASGTRIWEQRVTVEANQATVVDLTDANSTAPANFTPAEE